MIKILSVITSLAGYCSSFLCPKPAATVTMATGAVLGTYVSKKLHNKIRVNDEYTFILILIGALVSALRLLY